MQLIPGGGDVDVKDLLLPTVTLPVKAAKKGVEEVVEALTPDIPIPPPPPPVPTEEDPEIAAARERQRQAELRRRGRRASILTSGQGVEEELGVVNRPEARAATLLGE